MPHDQLSIFPRKTFPAAAPRQIIEPAVPTGESSVMQTLPAYLSNLRSSGYSESTIEKYFADVKRFSLYLREKKVGEITTLDIRQWISGLLSPKGEKLDRKTVNRKVSAIVNYFIWLVGLGAITEDPTLPLNNARIQSPLPDYLYQGEIETLYQEAGQDPRTYLLVLLFLEAGMKSYELFSLTKAHVDISDPYAPELWIKHAGKETKKDRKVALPAKVTEEYRQYIGKYTSADVLFPYTDSFMHLLFADLKTRTGIDKE